MTEDGGATDPLYMAMLAEFFDSPHGRAWLREAVWRVLERAPAEETA